MNLLCKLMVPWKCAHLFQAQDAFFAFLTRRNRILNALRVILFVITAIFLFIGYNADDGGGWSLAAIRNHPYYLLAVLSLVLALGATLVIAENEKQLPKELHLK